VRFEDRSPQKQSRGSLARLTPHQRRLPYHRWQHLYLWPLYGLLAIKWQLLDSESSSAVASATSVPPEKREAIEEALRHFGLI